MPIFSYQALQLDGTCTQGEIEARNRTEALRILDQQKLQPLRIQEKPGGKNITTATNSSKVAATTGPITLSRAQIIRLTEELSDMLQAGLQLEPALRVMQERQELSNLKHVVAALRQRVRDGSSFSNALRSVSPSFGELYCNLVAAGEVSGSLGQILARQVAYLNLMEDLRSRVTQALIYPAFITSAGITLIAVFMTVLVPQLTSLFAKTGQKLPLPTQLLIRFSQFLSTYGWWLTLLILASIIAFIAYIRSPKGKTWWHHTQLNIPLIGRVLYARFYAELTQTCATLVANGVPLLNAVRLMAEALPNQYLKALLHRVADWIADGAIFSSALRRTQQFPPALIDMVVVGEQTGDLPLALERVSRRYDKELNTQVQRMTALIQPIILILLALIVGAVCYSIIAGILQSVSGFRTRV
jgi:type II secretory pathway component PulF